MTANKRIFLNVIATYGRSLFNIACGLFSVRWVLSALGHDNYGLFNVIGGLTVFIGFINVQLSSAIGRYFAVAIGEYNVAPDKGLAMKNSHEWFSVAVVMQTIIPLLLVFVGYPLGAYAISKGWVHVPASQLNDCIWLWRYACISCLMGMLSSPFVAMLLAKQNIAEMTLIGVGQTVVRTIFFYYMTEHGSAWNNFLFDSKGMPCEDLIFNLNFVMAGAKWCTVNYEGYVYYRTGGTLLSNYKPTNRDGLYKAAKAWQDYCTFDSEALPKFGRRAEVREIDLLRSDWDNIWRPGTPYSLSARWNWLKSHPIVGSRIEFLKKLLYAILRRHCYFVALRRWHIKRLYPEVENV